MALLLIATCWLFSDDCARRDELQKAQEKIDRLTLDRNRVNDELAQIPGYTPQPAGTSLTGAKRQFNRVTQTPSWFEERMQQGNSLDQPQRSLHHKLGP